MNVIDTVTESIRSEQWILKIIDSCTDDFHFESVDKLIELYNEKFKLQRIADGLKFRRETKWNEIHHILK